MLQIFMFEGEIKVHQSCRMKKERCVPSTSLQSVASELISTDLHKSLQERARRKCVSETKFACVRCSLALADCFDLVSLDV